ncbi:unnamed protein product [Cuscuta campestris]|uniref:Late embryogenesis abundant protein LEA-2 subgroup domain-containing protein n=1 Tax=Cuscuta campestris TaxID=132261 RepID=A0A484MMH2_9ASTE|nr:unnamed protein product [Cuscuta campestris]
MSSGGAPRVYYESSRSSSKPSLSGCCRCLFFLVVLIAVLVVAFVLLVVLFVKPKKPQIDLDQVKVQIVAPTTAAVSSDVAAAAASEGIAITMSFNVTNDNKVGITFAGSRFVVLYKEIPLGQGFVREFSMPAHTVSRVYTAVFVSPAILQQTDVQSLLQDATKDRVELKVLGDPGAKLVILGLSSPKVQVAVDCSIEISPTKLAVISHQCSFDGVGV